MKFLKTFIVAVGTIIGIMLFMTTTFLPIILLQDIYGAIISLFVMALWITIFSLYRDLLDNKVSTWLK